MPSSPSKRSDLSLGLPADLLRHSASRDMRLTLPVVYTCLLSTMVASPAPTVPGTPVVAEALAAQNAKKPFQIAAADGAVALEIFADQANTAVVYLVEQVRGVRTNAIRGEFTPREALDRLVANTPLTVSQDARTGALMINRTARREQPRSPSQSEPHSDPTEKPSRPMKPRNLLTLFGGWLVATLSTQAQSVVPGSTASATQQPAAPVALPAFEVSSERDEGYLSNQTTSGTHTVEILKNVPSSISILNRELMDDLNITTIEELSEFAVTGHKSDDTEGTTPVYVFRGMNANVRLRNGVKWYAPVDSFSMERVEVLRGSNAFLYGEGAPGGAMNQVTKTAQQTNFQRLNLFVGSHNLHRVEFDINRRVHDTFSVRLNLAYQDQDGFVNHTKREFRGGLLSFTYRPFRHTDIYLTVERTSTRATNADGILSDAFSNTERLGTTVAYTATTGGKTYFPTLGLVYNMSAAPAQRRSSGTNTAVFNQNILPRESNFWGPNAHHNTDILSINTSLVQKIGDDLNVRVAWTHHDNLRDTRTNAGSSSAGIYLDRNPTLPGGAPNPYFNEYYTEYYITRLQHRQITADARITAVYDWKPRIGGEHKLIATGVYQYDIPDRQFYRLSEFVDPSSPLFAGTLVNENTLEAYRANLAALNANRFYRRFYLKYGDGAQYTHNAIVPGQSILLHDTPSHGINGRLNERTFKTPAIAFGTSGSYFGGRLRSLLGVRRDWFYQTTYRALFNHFTDSEYPHPDRGSVRVPGNQKHNTVNYGGVFHVSKMLSASANYAQSQNVSAGIGGEQLIPGTFRGRARGDSYEYGLRWTFLEGRIESNWVYFITTAENQAASPGIPTAVRNELAALFTDINQGGGDRQATKSTGFELETIANVTKNWRLIWNASTSELETSDRYPSVRHFVERARAANQPTPEADAFLLTVPEGTPVPGYTKYTSNLVTNYRFTEGTLRGFTLGGGFQYRDKTYRGNFDFDRDGVAERVYTPAYVLANLTLGYRTRVMNRPTSFNLNVNNVLDKDYFKSRSIGSGSWGDGRNFRFSIRTEL
jgi:iron complex outermembrane recepter protein